MRKQKLTRWFPAKVKPTRVGVYERQWEDGNVAYSHWDGRLWGWMARSAADAAGDRFPSTTQRLKWRGLSENHDA